jgi:FMN reductase
MAEHALAVLKEAGHEAEWLDLAEVTLPFCDGEDSYDDPEVVRLTELLTKADGMLLACPVYNYDVNAAAKNLVELTGTAWENKTVGFLLAAGGRSSYMSSMGLANSLMLDFRCLIVPRFVYATGESFHAGELTDDELRMRIATLAEEFARVARAVSAAGE